MFIQFSQKQYINSFDEFQQNFGRNSSRHEKYPYIGDFNFETSETALRNFCDFYKLKNLVRKPTCFNRKPTCIDCKPFLYRFVSDKLFKKFSRYTGN